MDGETIKSGRTLYWCITTLSFASARNEFVTLCQVAFAEMEQRLVASQPPKRVICLTDEQADQLEQHTLAEGASLAHLHSIRVINSSDVLYSNGCLLADGERRPMLALRALALSNRL